VNEIFRQIFYSLQRDLIVLYICKYDEKSGEIVEAQLVKFLSIVNSSKIKERTSNVEY